MNINNAKTGDIVTLTGTEWRVIGFIDRPAVLVERVGCEDTPINHRTHHAVVLGSPFSEEWEMKSDAALNEKR